jgi:hypothetical protein
MRVRAHEAHMGEIKNAELKIKNDGMPGKAGQSGGDPAAARFKMTFSTVMAGCWHKNGTRCYPVMDCIPLMTLFLAVSAQFRLFERIFGKKGQIRRPTSHCETLAERSFYSKATAAEGRGARIAGRLHLRAGESNVRSRQTEGNGGNRRKSVDIRVG